jgi:cysteine desulfurase
MAAIIGFTEALSRFVQPPVFPSELLRPLTAKLIEFLGSLEDVVFRGSLRTRLSNTVAFTVSGCDSITLLAGLDLAGICASGGAACSAGSVEPSHVLIALGVEKRLANSLLRFSLGRDSTEEEVETVKGALGDVIKQARCL